jgi:beta-glucanase (GH16 family)
MPPPPRPFTIGFFVCTVCLLQTEASWKLTWSDEFNGASLDLTKWGVQHNYTHCFPPDPCDEAQLYIRDAVSVGAGRLRLTTNRAHAMGPDGLPRNFTSGWVDTKAAFGQRYGRFEANCSLPAHSATGAWPAFWLMPRGPPAQCWPTGGEIDVFEYVATGVAEVDEVFGSYHWGTACGKDNAPIPGKGVRAGVDADWQTEWHLYSVEWDEHSLRYYLDEDLYFTRNASQVRLPTDPMYMILNQGVMTLPSIAGAWNYPKDEVVLEVEYVRVYEPAAVLSSSSSSSSSVGLAHAPPSDLVLLHEYPNARCLDGSSAGYYINPASSDSLHADHWLFVLEGGGMCSTEAHCTARAKTDLGSSNQWPLRFDWTSTSLTTNDTRNPFRGWNRVWVKYCSGDLYTGQRTTNTSNATWGLWFSGHHILDAVLNRINGNSNCLNRSDTFVAFSGGSAGGLGAFYSTDWVAAQYPLATVVGVPIGGFVPDIEWFGGNTHHTPSEDVRDVAFPSHVALFDSFLSPACVGHLDHDWQCMLPRLAYPWNERPLFIMEALTDACILCGFEGVGTSDNQCWLPLVGGGRLRPKEEQAWMRQYGVNASRNMGMVRNSTRRDGLFAPSCFMHCHFTLDRPLLGGLNAVDALQRWIIWVNATEPTITQQKAAAGQRQMDGEAAAAIIDSHKFRWFDTCDGDSDGFWPPCNPSCPYIPTAGSQEEMMKFM